MTELEPLPSTSSSFGRLPVLASVASDYETISGDIVPVIGQPTFDFQGILHHRRLLGWKKRYLAIQGRSLLCFRSEDECLLPTFSCRPKFCIDLRPVQLTLVNPIYVPTGGSGGVWHCEASEFVLTGPNIKERKGLHFQASDPRDCERWCSAIKLAINGRCKRCVTSPAKRPGHPYCILCAQLRRRERELLRQQQQQQFGVDDPPTSVLLGIESDSQQLPPMPIQTSTIISEASSSPDFPLPRVTSLRLLVHAPSTNQFVPSPSYPETPEEFSNPSFYSDRMGENAPGRDSIEFGTTSSILSGNSFASAPAELPRLRSSPSIRSRGMTHSNRDSLVANNVDTLHAR